MLGALLEVLKSNRLGYQLLKAKLLGLSYVIEHLLVVDLEVLDFEVVR